MKLTFNAKDCIKDIIATSATPQLKTLGYRKSAFTWRKSVGDIVRLVNVQLSRYNRLHESQFTVNLGVYHARFHEARNGRLPKGNLSEHHCDLRVRIGSLMGRNDYWWVIAHNKDNEKVRDGFAYNFAEHAIPWIEQFNDLNDIYQYLFSKRQYFNAAVAAYVLEMDNVEELISKAISHAPHDNFARYVQVWARDHGIAK